MIFYPAGEILMPSLSLPDIEIFYEISGNGPPILLLSGMLSDSASWAPLLPLLEPHFTVIRPDNRTTGRTIPWDAPANVEIFAGDAIAILDHLNISHCHLLGHSMGGLIAMYIAQSIPDRIASLTTAGTAPIRLNRNIELFKTILAIRRSNSPPDTWLRALFPWLFAPSIYDNPDVVTATAKASLEYPFAQSADAMELQIDALATFDTDRLHVPCPIPFQAILAEDDLLIPIDIARKAWGTTTMHVIPNAGHSIHWDAPLSVANLVLSFATSHPLKDKT